MTKQNWCLILIACSNVATTLAQEVLTQGHYSLKRTQETNALVAKVDVDAVRTNHLTEYELQHSTDYKTGEKERVFYNKNSNRKIRVRTMLFSSVADAEQGVLSQLNSVSVIFTQGSPAGGVIGDNSWYYTTKETGSTTLTFITKNVVISIFAQQEAIIADKLARELDEDIHKGNKGIELKDR